MYIEYACYDYSLSDDEVKANITSAINLGVKNLSIHYAYISLIKQIISSSPTLSISSPIDYPYGLSDSKIRISGIENAAKAGVSTIDMTVPAKFIANRKYDKLRDDIKNNLLICQQNNLILRYILEYRVFNHETLAKTCQILKNLGVEYVLPSSGHMIDDINDNLIASKYLMAKSNINVVCNGNIWTEKQAELVKSSNVYGVRLHYISALQLFIKNL